MCPGESFATFLNSTNKSWRLSDRTSAVSSHSLLSGPELGLTAGASSGNWRDAAAASKMGSICCKCACTEEQYSHPTRCVWVAGTSRTRLADGSSPREATRVAWPCCAACWRRLVGRE